MRKKVTSKYERETALDCEMIEMEEEAGGVAKTIEREKKEIVWFVRQKWGWKRKWKATIRR